MYSDDSCTSSFLALAIANATCTPNPSCSKLAISGRYGYISCPNYMKFNEAPPPRPGQVQVLTFSNATQCRFSNPFVGYYPLNVCTQDVLATARVDYSAKASCSHYTAYSGTDCSQVYQQFPTNHLGGTNANNQTCNSMNSGGSLKAYTFVCSDSHGNNNQQQQPAVTLNGYISYDLYSDRACTKKLKSTIVKPSQVCLMSGECIQVPGSNNLYGISKCSSTLPSVQQGQMVIHTYASLNCNTSTLQHSQYYPIQTCSVNMMGSGSIMPHASCSSYQSYSDMECQVAANKLDYTSASCLPNGNSNSLSVSCQVIPVVLPSNSTKRTVSGAISIQRENMLVTMIGLWIGCMILVFTW